MMLSCLLFLVSAKLTAQFDIQMVTSSADSSVILKLSVDHGEAVLLDADGQDQRVVLDLGKEPLIIERQTPGGIKQVPVYQLFGAHAGKLYLYRVSAKQLCVFDLANGKQVTVYEGGFPVSPKQLLWQGDRPFLLATLILETACSGEPSCSYFHELNPQNWSSERHVGVGKSFHDSFMKADIAVAFWLPKQERGGIYYTKSHDLHWVQFGKTEQVQATQFQDGAPKGKLQFGWFDNALHVIGQVGQAAVVYRLNGKQWQRVKAWSGMWAAFTLLGSQAILVDEAGNIQRYELDEAS